MMASIEQQIRELAAHYAVNLKQKIENRVEERTAVSLKTILEKLADENAGKST